MRPQKEEKFVFQSKVKPRHWSFLGKAIFISVIFFSALFVVFFQQDIRDRYIVSIFKPSEEIENITKYTAMTDSAKFYLYASQPEINSSDDFNNNCTRKEANSPILGCYTKNRIFIYDVKNDPRLQGVKSITAAHEMLHAAWDRLSDSQKFKLKDLLSEAYNKIKTEELIKRMEYYDREQPGDRIEELHSILGTEFSNLGNDLESYYKRYFSDRTSLVEIYNKYNNIFVELNNSQKNLLEEIKAMGEILKSRIQKYNSDVEILNNDVSSLEMQRSKAETGSLSDKINFNYNREKILLRIDVLVKEQDSIEFEQNKYKNLIDQYNSNVLIGNELTNSLDSNLKKPATVQ